jgi:hypothetical protein
MRPTPFGRFANWEGMMGQYVGSLYSVAPNKNIEWHIYIVEPEAETEMGRYLQDHFLAISDKLGTKAVIVLGRTHAVSDEIDHFLQKYLSPDMQVEVNKVTSGNVSAVVTRKSLPNTDAMAILPIHEHGKPLGDGIARLDAIVDAIAAGAFDKVVSASEAVNIQQGHFDLPTTDAGIMILRRAAEYFPIKIPLGIVDIELSKIVNHFLDKYPKINV